MCLSTHACVLARPQPPAALPPVQLLLQAHEGVGQEQPPHHALDVPGCVAGGARGNHNAVGYLTGTHPSLAQRTQVSWTSLDRVRGSIGRDDDGSCTQSSKVATAGGCRDLSGYGTGHQRHGAPASSPMAPPSEHMAADTQLLIHMPTWCCRQRHWRHHRRQQEAAGEEANG